MIDSAIENFGNGCGHNALNPRFVETYFYDRLPLFCQKAIEKCKDYYFQSNQYLPNLQRLGYQSQREKRSERREAIAVTLQTLFHYMQIHNGEVGFYQRKTRKLNSIHGNFLATKSGLTRKRLYRALADLRDAGYISSAYKYQKSKKGVFRKMHITIKESCLRHLGFSSYEVEKQQKYKRTSLAKQAPGTTEYQAPEHPIKLANKKVVIGSLDKMKDLLSKFKTNRYDKQGYKDFTGISKRDNHLKRRDTQQNEHKPPPEPRSGLSAMSPQDKQKASQKVLFFLQKGLTLEQAKAKAGL